MALIDALDAPGTASRPRLDPDSGQLIGACCDACGAASWPARAVCHRCGAAPLRPTAFGPTGSLLTYTAVWVPRPRLDPPYVLGQVKLADGPLIFAHVRELPEDAVVPLLVRLAVGHDYDAFPAFWFEPVRAR